MSERESLDIQHGAVLDPDDLRSRRSKKLPVVIIKDNNQLRIKKNRALKQRRIRNLSRAIIKPRPNH
ncbi:MAG: hypothetical protein KUG79_18000 [Pseudomonadales bacterium]|nr:hypothetical protein [Pseudomonadales bacterium]